MIVKDSSRRALYIAVSLTVLLLDQVTKAIVSAKIPLHATIPVIPGFFDLTHVQNTGAAFGLFAGMASPLRAFVLTGVAIAVFFGVLAYAWRSPIGAVRLQLALSLILGGAIGNLVDRIRLASVTDFLRFYIGAHEWPSFNVADSAISIGVALLAWDIWRRPSEEPSSSERPAEA